MEHCPACGELWEDRRAASGPGVACPACGRLATGRQTPYYGVYDCVEYDFDDVTSIERAEATDLLVAANVPYRWDPGFRLQVPPEHEDDVDALFGHSEGPGPPGPELDENAADGLARLFNASGRLRHDPEDEDAAAELADATGVVMMAAVPFGVNGVLWSSTGFLARQLLDLLDESADLEDVVAAADALHAVLRDHV